MNFDWSVVWRNANALMEGTELTILLAVTTMAISIPGGILPALMRLSSVRVLTVASASFTELFRNMPRFVCQRLIPRTLRWCRSFRSMPVTMGGKLRGASSCRRVHR